MESGHMISDFEVLVDELLKNQPNENLVKKYMEKLNMKYSAESVNRIGAVLDKMSTLVFDSKPREASNDLPKHP